MVEWYGRSVSVTQNRNLSRSGSLSRTTKVLNTAFHVATKRLVEDCSCPVRVPGLNRWVWKKVIYFTRKSDRSEEETGQIKTDGLSQKKAQLGR